MYPCFFLDVLQRRSNKNGGWIIVVPTPHWLPADAGTTIKNTVMKNCSDAKKKIYLPCFAFFLLKGFEDEPGLSVILRGEKEEG